MNKANLMKKLAALVMLTSGALMLAACGEKTLSTPYGSVSDEVYLSGNGYEITEKELYEEMRLNGSSVLVEILERQLFKDELAKIAATPEAYKDDLVEAANRGIFSGTTDIDTLKEMKADQVQTYVDSFIDTFYMVGKTITAADIDIVNFTDHSQTVLDYYTLSVAKKIYAKEELAKEVVDEDSTNFIKIEEDIQKYYETNVENQFDLSLVLIRFVNQSEANATLRHFNLKAYRNAWVVLQDPRNEVVTGYAATVLSDLGIENTGAISESDYQKYYDRYSVVTSVTAQRPADELDVQLDNDQVLAMFIDIYNYIYSYKDAVTGVTTVDGAIADLDNLPFTKAYADFSNTSLRSYVYSTLSTEESGTRFTAAPRSYGNNYYLAFKLKSHDEAQQELVDEDDKLIIYTDDTKKDLTATAQEYFDKIVESKLTQTYIASKASERLEDAKVTIYDSLLHLYLNQNSDAYALAKKSSKSLVAKMGDFEVSVDTFFAELESRLGVSVAIDMALREVLKASDYQDQITAAQMKEYKTNMETIIKQFGQGYYETSGYPATMGRKNFLMLAFRASSIDEAIENVYVSAELEKLYLNDFEAHYGETVYEDIATYANRLQNQFFSLAASHALIFVDMDEDDSPDDPREYFETLDAQEVADLKANVTELMQLIYDKAVKYSSFSTGLTAIVDEYKSAGRIEPQSCTTEPLDVTPECTWAKYKALGLNVMFQSLSTITNSTNLPGQQSSLDVDFYDRAVSLYEEIKAEFYDVDKKFPSQHLDTRPSDYADVLETSFGWHLILATGGASFTSAKFTLQDDEHAKDDDKFKIYENIELTKKDGTKVTVNAYSDTDAISANQVQIFLNEVNSEYGVENLPTSVKNATNAYLQPVYEKYTNSYTQLNLLYKLLATTNYTFASAEDNAKAQELVEINKRQFFSYTENEAFDEIYSDWFTTFN